MNTDNSAIPNEYCMLGFTLSPKTSNKKIENTWIKEYDKLTIITINPFNK